MSNKKDGTLYIGITNDLKRRVYEHKNGIIKGFTKKYNLDKLIYFEEFKNIEEAIIREKMMKKWNRTWKTEIIEKFNPDWKDLNNDLF
jgi:putative endonuclease